MATIQVVIPDELEKKINQEAKKEERTLSGEVRYILNQYYYGDKHK